MKKASFVFSVTLSILLSFPAFGADKITDTKSILNLQTPSYSAPKEDIDKARELSERGKEKEAIELYETHANKGDVRAMITVGTRYYQGQGVERSYQKAAEWFSKAAQYFDGDALNNLGVMFRDGLGVEKNLKIAYDLFWIVHLRGLGNEGTQVRAGGNINKISQIISKEEVQEAIEYTEVYVISYALALGKLSKEKEALKNDSRYHTLKLMNQKF